MISQLNILRMRNVSNEIGEEKSKHVFYFQFFYFFFEIRAVCEIMWKKMVQPDRSQMPI
jgi:hypothetical protein